MYHSNMQKITIKGVNHKDVQKKDGGTFQTCGILIDTTEGEVWVNGFGSPRTQALQKGETIYVELYDEEYNGKVYKKFRLPSLDCLLASAIVI